MSKEKGEHPKKSSGKSVQKKPEKAKKPVSQEAARPSSKPAPKKAAVKIPEKKREAPAKSATRQTEGDSAKAAQGKARPQKTPGAGKRITRTSGYRANVPFLRISPTKVRRIADHLRRKPYVEVMALLDVLPHKGARLLRKVIQSAAANALSRNKGLDEQMLFVKEVLVDGGPTMKRMWARGRGRADRLLKRSCHISAVVDEIGGKEVDNGSKG
jgi:large subunit ribosomal protein L22